MNISDFTLIDFQTIFEINNDYNLKKETVDDLTVISIDNFFKNPDDVVNALKTIPVNDTTIHVEKIRKENPSFVQPPGKNQLISNEYLNGVSASLYQLLNEQEYVPFNYSVSGDFQKLTEQLGKFAWYTNIFYPKMKNYSNEWSPRFHRSTFVFDISLNKEPNADLSFYKFQHNDKQYPTIDSIMEIEDLETKTDIRDKLNNMHVITDQSPEYYSPQETDLFFKYFTVPYEYNKLILYKGNNWTCVDYDSSKQPDICYKLNSCYTPNFNESDF